MSAVAVWLLVKSRAKSQFSAPVWSWFLVSDSLWHQNEHHLLCMWKKSRVKYEKLRPTKSQRRLPKMSRHLQQKPRCQNVTSMESWYSPIFQISSRLWHQKKFSKLEALEERTFCRISCSRKTPLHAGGHVLKETRHLVCVIWSCARNKS